MGEYEGGSRYPRENACMVNYRCPEEMKEQVAWAFGVAIDSHINAAAFMEQAALFNIPPEVAQAILASHTIDDESYSPMGVRPPALPKCADGTEAKPSSEIAQPEQPPRKPNPLDDAVKVVWGDGTTSPLYPKEPPQK